MLRPILRKKNNMLWVIAIGVLGGVCLVRAVHYFEALEKTHEPSLSDGIEIIEEDVLG